ncbi:MAG: HAD family hydrolase, partial [Pseudomonadota bacterium]
MMRAFENRPDCKVWDEPFYAAYLSITGIDHPMRQAVIDAGEPDWERVAARCVARQSDADVFYQKHMTHHMVPDIDTAWLGDVKHGFLLRHPERVLRSYVAKRESVNLLDIGVQQQWTLYERVAEQTGQAPLVVDSDDFLSDPHAYLQAMCREWGLAFSDRMLNWPTGPRDSDGAWGPHWYAAVWETTSFGQPTSAPADDLPPALRDVCEQAMPYYLKLFERRLQL